MLQWRKSLALTFCSRSLHAPAVCTLWQYLLQLTVRVTFDRGDVDHFIAEAVRLNAAGSAKYETIVAGEE